MNLFLGSDPRPIHFVGIAGSGMSPLAQVALKRGVVVTGSDRFPEGAPDLVGLGAHIARDHDVGLVEAARALITSAAIPADHPEVVRAKELGIPIVPRKEALAELVRGKATVAVAGTHGKTTTTVMATKALTGAGFAPTGLAGGRVPEWGGNAKIGGDDLFVVEADEYDQAFLTLYPQVAVINNFEWEHLESYGGSGQALEDAFVEFAGRADRVLIGSDDPGAEAVAEKLGVPIWRFGTAGPDIVIESLMTVSQGIGAKIMFPGGERVTIELGVPGIHNVRNAAAALGTVAAMGGELEVAADALTGFGGVGRRFERVGWVADVMVVDDYAHHPTEIAVTLDAALTLYPNRRLVVVFQPHLYSRTAVLADRMGASLRGSDVVFVTDVYAAREDPVPGVTGALVAEAAKSQGLDVRYAPDRQELLDLVAAEVRAGDLVMTLGAGDITTLGGALLRRLAES
jgi:UDP-N-acetylmuramate--alanine ligase